MKNKEIRIIALLVLDTVFFLLEAIIGYSVHSLALIADSFHMLNDIISLIIALWAVKVKNTSANDKYTYGWQRAEILGALINAVFLLALCFTIVMDSIQRFFEPQVITNPKLILIVGTAGLLSNGIGLVLFHEHGHSHSHAGGAGEGEGSGHSHSHLHNTDQEPLVGMHTETSRLLQDRDMEASASQVFDYLPDTVVGRFETKAADEASQHSHSHGGIGHDGEGEAPKQVKRKSMNMEGVFLHVMGDALGNVGVIITALIIWKTTYSWRHLADPITSLVITIIIFHNALPLCLKSSKILLQATPPYINSKLIVEQIIKLPLVKNVHDFHVWNLNEDILIASLHLELIESTTSTRRIPGHSPLAPHSPSEHNQAHQQQTTAVYDDSEHLPQGSVDSIDMNYHTALTSPSFDKKGFTIVVAQVRDILHKFGIHSVTIQPEFPNMYGPVSKRNSHGNGNNGVHYGNTSKTTCLVDELTNCDTESCK